MISLSSGRELCWFFPGWLSAIEATIVEVTFPELAEKVENATVVVKDSKGEVRDVVARDIAKGATKAQFDFVKTVKADDLTGVWSVNGVDYSRR